MKSMKRCVMLTLLTAVGSLLTHESAYAQQYSPGTWAWSRRQPPERS